MAQTTAQTDYQHCEADDYGAWGGAVAEVAPELMPEKLPPEFSPVAFPALVQRRRIELPQFKRP